MSRIQGDLKDRTFRFAKAILKLVDGLPHNPKGWELAKQMIRSGTSIGANVREADNAQSDADFAHKCNIARKEAAETSYWLQLCQASEPLNTADVRAVIQEADELARILSTIVLNTHRHMESSRGSRP